MAGATELPDQTGTLIVGAGIVGCSTAYHLTDRDHTDVTVVDQGPLPHTGGTSSFAPSGVFQTAPDRTRSLLARETRDLAVEFDAYEAAGSVEIATSDDRLTLLDRRLDQAAAWGIEGGQRVSPAAVGQLLPYVDTGPIRGGYHLPTDGWIETLELLEALRERAERRGATFHGQTRVTDIRTSDGAVAAVVTDRGEVTAREIVVAANVWTPLIGDMVGIDVPLVPVTHQYAITEPIDDLSGADPADSPWLRHPDGGTYARRHGDAIGIGNYNNDPTLVNPGTIDRVEEAAEGPGLGVYDHRRPSTQHRFARPATRPFTAADFTSVRRALEPLVPSLDGTALATGVNGLLAVTPDGSPILGEAPAVDGFWIAAAIRTTHAGGAGRVLADLLTRGTARIDVDGWHAARFQPHSGSPSFVREQGRRTYASDVGVPRAGGIESTGRTLRESPFFRYQDALEAEFYDLRYGGWKRPMWFGTNEPLLTEYDLPERAGRPSDWTPIEGVEHLAVRDRVGMCDLTSFTTFDVVGAGAEAFCQRAFTNDMALPVGGLTYTLLLDEAGGIHGDMTVVRVAHDRFHAISNSGGAGTKQIARLRRLATEYDDVVVSNRIGERCGISVTGPNAREMLEPVVDADLGANAFPYFTSSKTYVGDVPALALRVSYVGELGWEFHTSMEYGAELWETLWSAGTGDGVVPFGDGALVTMRLEKGFPAYGVDISPTYTPFEAGLEHTVDLDTEFVGRNALVTGLDTGPDRKRAVLTLDDPDAVAGTGTPVFDGDDRIGHVTSAGEGFSVDAYILYAYVPPSYTDPGTAVEVQYEGERFPATVRESVLFDPDRERLLA